MQILRILVLVLHGAVKLFQSILVLVERNNKSRLFSSFKMFYIICGCLGKPVIWALVGEFYVTWCLEGN